MSDNPHHNKSVNTITNQSNNNSSSTMINNNLSSPHITTHVIPEAPRLNIITRVTNSIKMKHTLSTIRREQKDTLSLRDRLAYQDRYIIVPDNLLIDVGGKKCKNMISIMKQYGNVILNIINNLCIFIVNAPIVQLK